MSEDDAILLKCPHCGKIFDFKLLSKNMWCVRLGYIIIQCPMCIKHFKMLMEKEEKNKCKEKKRE